MSKTMTPLVCLALAAVPTVWRPAAIDFDWSPDGKCHSSATFTMAGIVERLTLDLNVDAGGRWQSVQLEMPLGALSVTFHPEGGSAASWSTAQAVILDQQAMKKMLWGAWAAASLAIAQSPFLTDIQQLTHGGQNAEAYWAPDGKRLIFQTTRAPYDCDQIFLMNADGSDQHLVSTGKGRTTCAYFLSDNRHIVYASTHLAANACPVPPDRGKGYVWGVFAGYDIFLATDDGKIEKRLTDTPGYDAEATVNWKTGTMVYTSLASGDLDLWTMRPDGSRKRQITRTPGYDGGAVFSRDGKKLVWRANYPKTPELMARYKSLLAENVTAPMKMELVVANADGRNAHTITNFGCASFAPTFTPDGKQIVFSSNKQDCDSRYFELYRINLDGSGLEQVTHFGGFTSFPEFSPDGTTLVFCSDHDAKERYEFNIFTAKWAGR